MKENSNHVEAAKAANIETAQSHEYAVERAKVAREQTGREADELREVVEEVVRRLNRASR